MNIKPTSTITLVICIVLSIFPFLAFGNKNGLAIASKTIDLTYLAGFKSNPFIAFASSLSTSVSGEKRDKARTSYSSDANQFALPPVSYDYGDAPDTTAGTGTGDYQSFAANNGPRHTLNTTLYYLGTAPDADVDSLSNATGSGDLSDDGVKIGTTNLQGLTLNQGSPVNLTVTAGGSAKLYAWIDWNRNGIFGDNANEVIIAETTNKSTARTIPITPPASANSGVTFARFRYSTDLALGPLGTAADGEVEDYQINVLPSVSLTKTSNGGAAGFTFTLTNADTNNVTAGTQSTALITTTTSGTATTFDGDTGVTGSQPIKVLTNGDISITETIPAGWVLTSGTCTNGTTTWNATGNSVLIPAADYAGKASGISCSFINSRYAISGIVFEDPSYSGGAGRSLLSSGGSPQVSARVELYNSAGTFLSFDTTDTNGNYQLLPPSPGTYFVRVVNTTVRSSRPGYGSSVEAVQTFRTDATSGTPVDVVDRVGGENPTLIDSASGTTTLAALTTATTTPQSLTRVAIGATPIAGIDFGYNFDTIVNTRDAGQGSLRQFIINSNFLKNTSLAQIGQPAGVETSIFMISDGNAHPGLRAGIPNQLTNGVAKISPITALPFISDTYTKIDGTTQTANIGDTNAGQTGTGGTVGVSGLTLSKVDRPEVQISTTSGGIAFGIILDADFTTIRGLAVNGFGTNCTNGNIVVNSVRTDVLIEKNVVGSEALNFVQPSFRTVGNNIIATSTQTNLTVRNNLVGFASCNGFHSRVGGVINILIENNEFRSNGRGTDSTAQVGIQLMRASYRVAPFKISGNLIIDSSSYGIEHTWLDGGLITENTISGNGITGNLDPTQGEGISLLRQLNTTVLRNIISGNAGDGVLVDTVSGSGNNLISQNSIYDNGGLGIELGSYLSTVGTVTPNDGAIVNTSPNRGMDYPVFTNIQLVGTTLTVKGFIGTTGAGNTAFGGAVVEIFKADNTPANQNGEHFLGDGLSVPHGEGSLYLGKLTADANGLFNGSIPVIGLTSADAITATATNSANNTSEFSATQSTDYRPLYGYKSVALTNDADSSGAPTPGDIITWTVTYVNTSLSAATAFQINDVLPSGLAVTSAGTQTVTVAGGAVATKATTYTGVAGSTANLLAAGASIPTNGRVTVSIPVIIQSSAAQSNRSNQASATSTGNGLSGSTFLTDNVGKTADLPSSISGAPVNGTVPAGSIAQGITSTIDPTVVGIYLPSPFGLKSVKLTSDTDGSGTISNGDKVTYTISYINIDPVVLNNFQINDVLPAGLTITSTGAQVVTGANKNPNYTGASAGADSDLLDANQNLNPEGVITVEIPAVIGAGALGTIENQASASSPTLSADVLSDNVGANADLAPYLLAAPYNLSIPTGSVAQTITGTNDSTTFTLAGKPVITLVKSCPNPADCTSMAQIPNTELTYSIEMKNVGTLDAQNVVVYDPVPEYTDFKIDSANIDTLPIGVTFQIEYSDDLNITNPTAATWTYIPISGGGGADTGFDRNVRGVRWRITAGALSSSTINNTAVFSFVAKIK